MNQDWLILIHRHGIEGARAKFEEICGSLFKKKYSNIAVRSIEANPGDAGIDIYIGEITEKIDVIQCKFFSRGRIGDSQKDQIRKSFKTAIESNEYRSKSWTLCVNVLLSLDELKWWESWRKTCEKKYDLPSNFIKLLDGNSLVDLLKEEHLYNTAFELEDKKKIDEIHQSVVGKASMMHNNFDLKSDLKITSYALLHVKNHIEDKINTHITRKETAEIIKWIKTDLEHNQNNILILTGDKGTGKSGILKDVYAQLSMEDNYILGIKADKYYCTTLNKLEIKLFDNKFTFDNLLSTSLEKKEPLIVIIDQIDALSLTLSSNREYIETYNKLIFKFQQYKHVKVIISCRSFDLKYDAELIRYASENYKKIQVELLPREDVINTLRAFKLNIPPDKNIELLKTPNHLDIYCRIFHNQPNINVETIFTLKSLYDQLWTKHISQYKKLKLKKLIYIIAQRMYQEQKISIGNIYQDDYFNALNHLKSNNLIIEYENEIQFFHQSFYEYSFAKWFVEKEMSLEDYILENKQSLYVRSVLKMVLDYQRDFREPKYTKTICNILSSDNYRFHIKSLIITNLSNIKTPSLREKRIFTDIIIGNKDFEDVFFSSVHSIGWVEFLISEDIPSRYLSIDRQTYKDEYQYNFIKHQYTHYIWLLCINNLYNNPLLIIEYLVLKTFEDKESFIARLLSYNSNWEDKKLLSYFEEYLPYTKVLNKQRDNFDYFNTLKSIFPYHEDYCINLLPYSIIDAIRAQSHNSLFDTDLSDTIKNFFAKAPYKVFDILFNTYQELINETKTPHFSSNDKFDSPLFESYLITKPIFSVADNSEKEIIYYIDKYIQELSIESFKAFFQKYKDTNDVLLLIILTTKLASNPSTYKDFIYDYLQILESKNTFKGFDKKLQFELRLLIAKTYPYFTAEQQKYINHFLLTFSSVYDYYIGTNPDGKKKINLSYFGKQKYLFIKAIDPEYIKKNKDLYNTLEELKRKFGEINEKEPLHSSKYRSGSFNPPLPLRAYKKMSLIQWKNSILKYNKTSKYKDEHADSFRKEVCLNPEKFYPFLKELLQTPNISINYVLKGIGGLIEIKFNPLKVKELFFDFITTHSPLNEYDISYLCYYSSYFIKTKTIDTAIITFLKDVSLDANYFEDKNIQYLKKTDLINNTGTTIQGSAISRLIECHIFKEYNEIIFSTLEKIIYCTPCRDTIKIFIVSNLAYLNDVDRSFALFKEITNTDNVDILKYSIESAQYFNFKYHTELDYYFNRILETPEIHKESFLMVTSWLHDLDPKKELYNRFISTGKNAKLCALDIAEEFLINNESKEINQKALAILFEFLSETDKDIAMEYSSIILRKFKPENFEELIPFLKEYSSSTLCEKKPTYFIKYLTKCSTVNALEVLKLIENINFKATSNNTETYHYDKEPIQLILSIYSKLVSETNKNYNLIDKALNIFDNMLTNKFLRSNANEAIESLK